MTRVLVVANSASGGSGDGVLSSVRTGLAGAGPVEVVTPESRETFDEEVRAAAADAELVVVAGGDGTINCVVNALGLALDRYVFAVVPMGTGNDLARTLGIEGEPGDVAQAIGSWDARTIDVGRITGAGVDRLFVNACMGGFPVAVDEAVDEKTKKRLGPLAFWIGGLKAAPNFERSRVTINGTVVDDCVAVGVGNGRTCGGGMKVWPNADPGDGELDACALPAANPLAAVHLAARVARGTHGDLDSVTPIRARSLEIDAKPAIEVNVDGELLDARTPLKFEIADKLRVRVPGL